MGLRFSVRDNAGEFGIGTYLSVNFRFAAHTLNARASAQRRHFQHQSVAGNYGATKARFLDPSKEHQLLIAVFDFAQRQDCAALRQRFDHQHARHDRRAWKVALEIRFVNADLLDADYALARHKFDDAIDEQKRVTMREKFFYRFRIEDCLHRLAE